LPHLSSVKPLGTPFIELQSVDSTNNYARQQIQAASLPDLPERQSINPVKDLHGTAYFAHEQIAGKGQRGNSWLSEKDANIAISIIVNPSPLLLSEQFQLNVCVAVAVQNFFMKYAGDDTKIKWPNDIYWQDRKAGGILIESGVSSRLSSVNNQQSSLGSWDWSVIGIGININQTSFPAELPNPVSLKQITGKSFDTITLAKELCIVLNEKFDKLMNDGFKEIFSKYLLHLYKRNATVKLKKGNRVFEATIKTISPSGKLIAQHSIEEEFEFGDVEWLIK
jgi:BirA family biotin operon repressor/biotin-[acetyl-CoA-carboxylase] ligase